MPTFYTRQKQQELTAIADQLAEQLESADREDIPALIGNFTGVNQTNIIVNIGQDKYTMITWKNSVSQDTAITSYVTFSSASVTDRENTEESSNIAIFPLNSLLNSINSQSIEAQRNFTIAGEAGTLNISMTLAPVEEQ